MLRVLQVVPRLDAGGVERTTIDIADAIVRAGGTAFVASKGGRLEVELAEKGGVLVRLPLASKNPWVIWRNAARLAAIIRERKIGLIHARSRAPAWSALLAARHTGVPFVTTYAGAHKAGGPLKRYYNSVMARGDAVICNSEWTAEHVRAVYPASAERLVVIPRGTDLSLFDAGAIGEERREAAREALGMVDSPGPVLLLPARLTRWKGQLVFIEALRRLKDAGRLGPARAVIAGDAQGRDEYVTELQGAIANSGLKSVVTLSPSVIADMPAALATADIVVSPAIEPEAFGRIAVEAAAMGRIVIASDAGGARETVATEAGRETGFRAAPGDATALAEAIAAALQLSGGERSAMAARARAHATKFDLKVMTDATLAVYRRLREARERP